MNRQLTAVIATIAQPKDKAEGEGSDNSIDENRLPQTLVRIPIQQAEDAKKASQPGR